MNCKPGDLAYIVGGLENPSPNLGRIVEVLHLWGEDEHGPNWLCKSIEPIALRGPGDSTVYDTECISADAWLRPITGLPITDDIKDEVTV